MAKTEADIISFMREKADSLWASSEQPFLLSQAPPGMKEIGLEYQAILGEERLKAFLKRTEKEGGYRLVAHPLQKAKIGIVPSGVDFEFPLENVGGSNGRRSLPDNNTQLEYSRGSFLRALSRLSDDELDQIVIPTRIFVKLIGGR